MLHTTCNAISVYDVSHAVSHSFLSQLFHVVRPVQKIVRLKVRMTGSQDTLFKAHSYLICENNRLNVFYCTLFLCLSCFI